MFTTRNPVDKTIFVWILFDVVTDSNFRQLYYNLLL